MLDASKYKTAPFALDVNQAKEIYYCLFYGLV